jgi:hypothetical protein
MNKLDELLTEILEETKSQENKREEYIKLIHELLKNNTRTGCEIIHGDKNVWQLHFYINKSNTSIGFLSHIVERNDGLRNSDREDGLSLTGLAYIDEANRNMDKAINYLINVDKIDDFIEYLVKKAIPLFLQNQRAERWYI